MDTNKRPNTIEIRSIMVTVNGELIDLISFADEATAETYKQGVRRWAENRGVTARVWTQTMHVEGRLQGRLPARLAS